MTLTNEAARAELIGHRFPVGPDGFVILRDVMGCDLDIAKAARVSYNNQEDRPPEKDVSLIRYLIHHRHSTPVEMGELKFEIKLPIFVERQWVRHRTASTNEVSARYTELPNEMYDPGVDALRLQSTTNKQGSDAACLADAATLAHTHTRMLESYAKAYAAYEDLLTVGVARELARTVLPVATYTRKVWKIDLHNLLHLLKLRTDSHAQQELREYANVLAHIVSKLFPVTWAAFVEYVRDADVLSVGEQVAFRVGVRAALDVEARTRLLSKMIDESHLLFMSDREREELKTRWIRLLGLPPETVV